MPTIADYVQRMSSEMTSGELSRLFGQAVDDPAIDVHSRQIIRSALMPFYQAAQNREARETNTERDLRYFRNNDYPDYGNVESLDTWYFPGMSHKKIDKMSIKALKEASKQLEEGWQCYGQRNKSVTINRILKEKTRAA